MPPSAQAQIVADRLRGVRERISRAAERAGRDSSSVRLLAVSKGVSTSQMREAYDAGQRHFGENYAQELAQKGATLDELDGLELHFIGQVQRNKAPLLARWARCVHTIDRVEAARALATRVAEDARLDVLVEVRLADEPGKGGCAPTSLGALLDEVDALPRLRLRGLMAIPPPGPEPQRYFAMLRELRDRHAAGRCLEELSMGMSADFEAAIAEGATMVRVGTAIFGERMRKAGA